MIYLVSQTMIFRRLLLLLLLMIPTPGRSQEGIGLPFGHSFLFNMKTTETRNMVRQPVYFSIPDTAIYKIFDRQGDPATDSSATVPASPILLGVKLAPGLTHYHSAIVSSITKSYYSFLITDSSDATLIAMGINDSNYRNYHYHVVENDSIELVPWTPVTDLRLTYGAKRRFGFIGQFAYPGRWIVVEVANTKDYSIREGVVFDWRTDLKPKLEQIIFATANDYFNVLYPSLNRGYATRFDKTTNAPQDLRFPEDSVRSITFQFKKEGSLVHSAHLIRHTNGNSDTVSLGMIDEHGYLVADQEAFAKPGRYEFVFQRQLRYPAWDEAQLLRIPFEVLTTGSDTALVRRIFIAIGITLISLIVCFIIYRRSMRRMMQQMAQQKESAQLKLRSIQSQLNPHFIFNALSSIQNLMNKHSTLEANHYLTRFAALTRSALNSGSLDMISLEDEWKMADDYLQMEQLRFGFSYELQMHASIQPANTEVPPMLLQPLIENAVRHGVAGRQGGVIKVSASRSGKDLVITVFDNGRGFDASLENDGFGLKLSRERLVLLNSLYPGEPFLMEVDSSGNGTSVTITFKEWLS